MIIITPSNYIEYIYIASSKRRCGCYLTIVSYNSWRYIRVIELDASCKLIFRVGMHLGWASRLVHTHNEMQRTNATSFPTRRDSLHRNKAIVQKHIEYMTFVKNINIILSRRTNETALNIAVL